MVVLVVVQYTNCSIISTWCLLFTCTWSCDLVVAAVWTLLSTKLFITWIFWIHPTLWTLPVIGDDHFGQWSVTSYAVGSEWLYAERWVAVIFLELCWAPTWQFYPIPSILLAIQWLYLALLPVISQTYLVILWKLVQLLVLIITS